MKKFILYENISLALIFLILNNYLLLSLSSPLLLIKVNFIIFLATVLIFYFKQFSENVYLKIFFLFLILISLGTPAAEWDSRSIWLFHAKRIFYDESIFSVADNYAAFSHNAYPSLTPALASSFAHLFGYWNEVFPKISFLFMFFPPLVLSNLYFKNNKYLLFLFIVFFVIGKYLFNGMSDGILAVYFSSSALLMYFLFLTDNKFYQNKFSLLVITSLFFISLTLIKNEGSVLLLILFFSIIFMKFIKKQLAKDIFKIFFLSFSFLPIILWKVFCYSKGIGNDYINTNILINLLPRIYELSNYKLIIYFLFLNEKFLICLAFCLLSFWNNWNKDLFIYISIIVLFYAVALFIIYLSTPYDFYFQLDTSASRVIKTLSLLLACVGLHNSSTYYLK